MPDPCLNDRILGVLQEFRSSTIKRLDSIENKIEDLSGFKWKIIGGSAVISFIVTALGILVRFK